MDNPGQYHFDREQLLVSMVYFTVRLAEQPAFVQAVSAVRLCVLLLLLLLLLPLLLLALLLLLLLLLLCMPQFHV